MGSVLWQKGFTYIDSLFDFQLPLESSLLQTFLNHNWAAIVQTAKGNTYIATNLVN